MEIVPVICPRCGERQNQLTEESAPQRQIAKAAVCMACQYAFADEEYRTGLDAAWQEIAARLRQRSSAND